MVPSRGQAGPAPVIKSVTSAESAMLRENFQAKAWSDLLSTAALALLALVAPHGSAAEAQRAEREIVLNLPRPLGAGETAFIEIEVGAVGRGRIEVTTDTGRALGVVSPFGVRAGQNAGTYTLPVPATAIRDGRVAVRLTMQARRNDRPPTAQEVRGVKLTIAGRALNATSEATQLEPLRNPGRFCPGCRLRSSYD